MLLDDVSFIAVPHQQLVFLAATRGNVNCAMAFQFLYHLIAICKAYCQEELVEEDIRNKLTLLYEILDEVMDYGCPQFTDPNVLQQYIREGGLSEDVLKNKEKLRQLTCMPTGDQWRPRGLVYRRNEVYIDVV
jgi:hypothetical protein